MQVVFTLCSINYLAQAKTLGDSVRRHNPDYKFIIGLIDKNHRGVDLGFLGELEVIEVDQLEIDGFADMCARYNIVELVTATKPFYFDYLFRRYPEALAVTYFDPDIKVFTKLTDMAEKLKNFNVILTPHFTRPIEDDLLPSERHVMNTGVFNLGFAAMRRSSEANRLNQWWMKRLRRDCVVDLPRGLFVDQLWMNLAPMYFDKVLIEKHPGWNTAHWNLHERTIEEFEGRYFVNHEELVFYHFSHFSPKASGNIATFHTRFTFATRPDLVPLYKRYTDDLIANRYFDLIGTPCFYVSNVRQKEFKRKAVGWLRQNLPQPIKMKIGRLLKHL